MAALPAARSGAGWIDDPRNVIEAQLAAEAAVGRVERRLTDLRRERERLTVVELRLSDRLTVEREVRGARRRVLGARTAGLRQARRRETRSRQDLRVATRQAIRASERLETQQEQLKRLIVERYKSAGDAKRLHAVMGVLTSSRSVTDVLTNLHRLELTGSRKGWFVELVARGRDERVSQWRGASRLLDRRVGATEGAEERRASARRRVTVAERRLRATRHRHHRVRAAGVALARAVEADMRRAAAQRAASAALRAGLRWRAGWLGPAGLFWPVDGSPSSGFGPRVHPIRGGLRHHAGVDVPAPVGLPVTAAGDGVVTAAGSGGGYGLRVVIDHGDGMHTLYAHASQLLVGAGHSVEAGEVIALVGSTGASTGPHLHFEVHSGGVAQDPLRWFGG